MQKAHVDAAPFKAILERRIEELERDPLCGDSSNQLAFELGVGTRTLYRFLNEVQEMRFDTADRIVTRILGPMAWYTDEALHEIYMSTNLTAVDERFPILTEAAA